MFHALSKRYDCFSLRICCVCWNASPLTCQSPSKRVDLITPAYSLRFSKRIVFQNKRENHSMSVLPIKRCWMWRCEFAFETSKWRVMMYLLWSIFERADDLWGAKKLDVAAYYAILFACQWHFLKGISYRSINWDFKSVYANLLIVIHQVALML